MQNKALQIEHLLDFHSVGKYRGRGGENIGAIICRVRNAYIVRFGFTLTGVHSDISIEQSVSVVQSMRQFCKEMLQGESVKIEWSSFNDYRERSQELKRLYRQSDPPIQALLTSSRHKLKELSSTDNKKGVRIRKSSKIVMWASFSLKPEELELDFVEKGLLFATNQIKRLSGEQKIDHQKKYEDFLLLAYREGFQQWSRLFDRLPAQVKSMTAEDVWEDCWLQQNRFGNTQVAGIPPIPHLTVVDTFDKTVTEILNGRHNIRSVLSFANNAHPKAGSELVYVDKKHITVLTLTDEPSDSEQGYTEAQQINYLGKLMQKDFADDLRIVLEFGKPDQKKARKAIQEGRDEAIARAKEIAKTGGVSVSSEDDALALVEAERELIQDGAVMLFGLMILVYRDTKEDSKIVAEKISNYFQYPAKCSIELQVAYHYWISSLPYSARPILKDRFSRQLKTPAEWMPSYFPVSCSVPLADAGAVEFLAKYGQNPIPFNLKQRRGHTLILGKTGCGKSVLAGEIIQGSLAEGLAVTIVDTPTSKEASTFKDLARLVNGVYVDILDPETCYNFFETPNIDTDDPEREEYLKDFHSSVFNILNAMVMGDPSITFDGVVASRYKAILVKALRAFFNSTEILLRYESAKKHGIGSPEWEQMPCLTMFITYLTPARLDLTSVAEQDALTSVRNNLESWAHSTYGSVIAHPSKVSLKNKQLVVIGLRAIKSPGNAVTWSAITDSILTTRAIHSKKNGSAAFIDEAGVKFQYSAFAQSFADYLAIARKANMVVLAATQSPGILDPQFNDKTGQQIIANLRYKFVGFIVPELIDSYARVVSLAPEMFEPLCSAHFAPNYQDGLTSWLMLDESHANYIECRVCDLLLTILANEEHERAARQSLIDGLSPRESLEVLYNSTKPVVKAK
jgi:hypothetical protein